jgi:V/A-type H+-transporting ATPase subunit I
MGMRPQAARWFELLTPREELTKALECLAETGAVELQTHSQPEHALELPGLQQALDHYGELARRFGAWWPTGTIPPIEEALEPITAMHDALARLTAWCAEAGPLIQEGEQLEVQSAELLQLDEALAAPGIQIPDLHRLATAGPVLGVRLYRLPPKATPRSLPPSVIIQWLQSPEGAIHMLAVGALAQLEGLDRQMAALKARRLTLPDWLPNDAELARYEIYSRRNLLGERRKAVEAELAALSERHSLARALGTMALMEWFAGQAPSLPVTEHFAWVTGWTSDVDGHEINGALERGQVRHLLRYKAPPPGLECPVVLHNPRWVRVFEIFPRLLGTPDSSEADPSRVVALIAPLMFGFMFGDVGHGAVLLAIGLWFRQRVPVLGLLVPYGAMSILFGLLFGSVFADEALIPALWMHPIQHPGLVLAISLGFGVSVIALGLALDLVGAFWRRKTLLWLATRGGITAGYVGLVGAFLDRDFLWLMLGGFAWFLVGSVLTSRHKLIEIPKAIGELLESVLQLGVNTVSFVRVGAFALAHSGLSAAVVGMAAATGGGIGWLLVMILGNALVIALEGLIVGIQTTRLLLFEFFIRFLTAEGRQLRPLTGPSTAIRPTGRRFP